MSLGFQTRVAEVVTIDFRNFKLVAPIELTGPDGTRYRMPAGGPSDLASVPRAFWDLLPPFGEYALEAFAHDAAYQNWLERWDNAGGWVKAGLTKPQCDELFGWLMAQNPRISAADRSILYHAVVECGAHAFKADRS
jgi:hypothetical protein